MNQIMKSVAQPEPDRGRAYVLRACRQMLRPIARLLIKSGIVHRDLAALMREVYVDVARSEFGLRGRQTSISRTALLTGLARKEVRRISDLLGSDNPDQYAPSSQDRISRVLSGWHLDPDYTDSEGKPRAIAVDGLAPSFADLKARYGGDVPASAMLRELLGAGTVKRLDDGKLVPTRRNFLPNPDNPGPLIRAGSVIEDLGTTVMYNLHRGPGDLSRFERRVVNTNMPADRLNDFREFLVDEGQGFLERVDAWLTQHEDTSDESEPVRFGLGMYIIKRDE